MLAINRRNTDKPFESITASDVSVSDGDFSEACRKNACLADPWCGC